MRERLISLIKDSLFKHIDKSCLLAENIADDLLENGVVVLPCKVGDKCYPLDASESEFTCEETISRITISERNIIIGYYEHWDYFKHCRKTDNWRLPLRTRILGKGVFLSREEAEAKLKGETK